MRPPNNFPVWLTSDNTPKPWPISCKTVSNKLIVPGCAGEPMPSHQLVPRKQLSLLSIELLKVALISAWPELRSMPARLSATAPTYQVLANGALLKSLKADSGPAEPKTAPLLVHDSGSNLIPIRMSTVLVRRLCRSTHS